MSKAFYVFPTGQQELGFPRFTPSPGEEWDSRDEALGISLVHYGRMMWDLLVPDRTPFPAASVADVLQPVEGGSIQTRLEFRITASFLAGRLVPVLLWREVPDKRQFDPICGSMFLSAKNLAALSMPEAPPLARAIAVAMGLPEEEFPLVVEPMEFSDDAPYAEGLERVIEAIGTGQSDEALMASKLDDLMFVPTTTVVRTVPDAVVVPGVGIAQGQANGDMETAELDVPVEIEENDIVIVHRSFISMAGWLKLCAFAQGLTEKAYDVLGLGDDGGDAA